jgi:thymidylate synthase
MQNYLELLSEIMNKGVDRKGRNATTRSLFCRQLRWDLTQGFPAVTTKKLYFRSVLGELLWFLEGNTDDNRLREIMNYPPGRATIWTANAEAPYWKPKARFPGDLGRIYGAQWRDWTVEPGVSVDQISWLIGALKLDPFSRRHILTAWNPAEIERMSLPPCHPFSQFVVHADEGGKPCWLNCALTMRSCDMFLGAPFNIASYALLIHMIAQVTGLRAHQLVITFNDAHIYHEHFDAVYTQLKRFPKPLPKLDMSPYVKDIDHFDMDDFLLQDYNPEDAIPAPMIA